MWYFYMIADFFQHKKLIMLKRSGMFWKAGAYNTTEM